jgi:hypothetical protein
MAVQIDSRQYNRFRKTPPHNIPIPETIEDSGFFFGTTSDAMDTVTSTYIRDGLPANTRITDKGQRSEHKLFERSRVD